jgi:DNA polymerase III epsilon subunit-like protein
MSRLALIFDVETSGLIKVGEPFPHILQLSYLLYDIVDKQLIVSYDTFVKPSEPVIVSDVITRLTGITQTQVDSGKPIKEVICDFFEILKLADIIVAHNIEFDKKMISLELSRLYPEIYIQNNIKISLNDMVKKNILNIWNVYVFHRVKERAIEEFCTMKHSKSLCNILLESKKGGMFVKYPKLSETYNHLFKDIPENLHNSLTDTTVCLRCYMKLYKNEDIGEIMV